MSQRNLLLVLMLAASAGWAGAPPLLVFEAEHARLLRGPSWVRRDAAASRLRCIELMGERARALLEARVLGKGVYRAWARGRSATGAPAALLVHPDSLEPLHAEFVGQEWAWVPLGGLEVKEGGFQPLKLSATGTLRLDQLLLAGDPDYTPQGIGDSSQSCRYFEAEVYRSDDFMRSQRETGPWELASGKWLIQELKVRNDLGERTGRHYDPTRSANAFSFIGTGTAEEAAVALTGYPFWRNYSFEAAVRSPAGRTFGLILHRQGAGDYYLFRCDVPSARLELLRYLDGIPDRLALARRALRANQWYRLRFDACDGELSAAVDGHVVLRAVDHTFLQGPPGLWSADPDGCYFDDVLVRSYRTIVERVSDASLPGWEASGSWVTKGRNVLGAGSLVYREEVTDFEAAATIEGEPAQAGFVFDWRDAAHHARAVLDGGSSQAYVCEVRGGETTAIASAPLPKAGGSSRRVRLEQEDGRVRLFVDGREVVGAWRPDSGSGRVGLFAKGHAVAFRDIELAPAQSPPPVRVHNRIFAGEDTMAAWAGVGSDWQVASSGPRTVAWHEIEHFGDCTIRYSFPSATALAGPLGLVVRGEGTSLDSGYQLVAAPQPNAPAKLTLLCGKQEVGSAQAPAAAISKIELSWRAQSAVVSVDGKELLWHRAEAPPPGRRVAIWTEGWLPELGLTAVDSTNLVNDWFESAACEWRAESGDWLMQNRWTCSPQWSWYGGGSSTVAMLWRKQTFRGDIAVHFFAAFQMKQRQERIYRPSELNVTICGDGRNPFSGYTFVYGGWLNTATALFRREQIVARTTKEVLRPPTLLDSTPDTNHLHRKWWHIALEKHGSRVACYVDDQLALEFDDPEPLDGGGVCLWTHDNSVMIARSWIAYEAEAAAELPPAAPAPLPEPRAPPLVVEAPSHVSVVHGFEAGLGSWQGTPDESVVRLEPRDDGRSLAVINRHAGGTFALRFPLEPFDAMACSRLTFDYRVPPDVKVNLHVRMNGRDHAVVFTDTAARVAGVPILGRIEAQADDAWHTADVDLRALLLRCYPAAQQLPVQAISLDARDKRRYLSAGLGGNYAGLTYRLDNVRLCNPGPPDLKLSWDQKLVVSYALDREPATVPDDEPEAGASFERTGLADGTWYFHLKAQQPDRTWSRTAHIPVVVDARPPQVKATSPAAGARSPAHVVTVDFADASGVVPSSLAVSLLGQEHPVQVVPSDPKASFALSPVTYDPVSQRLAVDLAALPLSFQDGQAIQLAVTSARDFLGHTMPPYELSWSFDRSNDDEPPRHLRLVGSHPDLCRDDFETGLGEWQADPTYALIERDGSTAATGRYSLRIHNPHSGGPFTVTARSTAFDAGRFPIVSFDYRVPNNVRADLLLTLGGTVYTVRFTDPGGANCIGGIPGVQADDQWHHTEFNLHEMITASIPNAGSAVISSLAFGDTGYAGNADGVEWHIDNFCVSPATSTRGAPLEWKLAATDPSGIAGYQFSLSKMPAPTKWQDCAKPEWQFRDLGAGIFHFLVRARDGAGNWSEPVHRKILIDDEPPTIQGVHPKASGRAAESHIRVTLADTPAGIDRDKTVLTIAGREYSASDQGVSYDARTNTLAWLGGELAEPVAFANRQKVVVRLDTQDNVGNAATTEWAWTMDYALDKAPPPAPYVTRVPVRALSRSTFESDAGTWHEYGRYGRIERVTATAATGRYALRVEATRTGSYFGAYAYRSNFDASTYPIVSFDYRIPPGLPINLLVHVGSWHTIKLTSPTAHYTVVGSVPLKADDHWHHAEINLLRFLKPRSGSSKVRVRYLLFADIATRSVHAGAGFCVDNFAVSAPASSQKLQFEWSAVKDHTGIAGYAYALDKTPGTVPTGVNSKDIAVALANPGPGDWFFHLRAQDGAGNWGPVTHLPLSVPTTTAKR